MPFFLLRQRLREKKEKKEIETRKRRLKKKLEKGGEMEEKDAKFR